MRNVNLKSCSCPSELRRGSLMLDLRLSERARRIILAGNTPSTYGHSTAMWAVSQQAIPYTKAVSVIAIQIFSDGFSKH